MKESLHAAPESFYEAFTYVIPAGYFWLSLAWITGMIDPLGIGSLLDLNNAVTQIMTSIAVVLFLLVSGQILNTFCHYWAIAIWWLWIRLRRKVTLDPCPWRTREERWRMAKNSYAETSAHLSKVTAKRLMSLNVSFVSLLLMVFVMINSSLNQNHNYGVTRVLLVFVSVGVLSITDYFKRHGDEMNFVDSILSNSETIGGGS